MDDTPTTVQGSLPEEIAPVQSTGIDELLNLGGPSPPMNTNPVAPITTAPVSDPLDIFNTAPSQPTTQVQPVDIPSIGPCVVPLKVVFSPTDKGQNGTSEVEIKVSV